jgi:hypothetical protein
MPCFNIYRHLSHYKAGFKMNSTICRGYWLSIQKKRIEIDEMEWSIIKNGR